MPEFQDQQVYSQFKSGNKYERTCWRGDSIMIKYNFPLRILLIYVSVFLLSIIPLGHLYHTRLYSVNSQRYRAQQQNSGKTSESRNKETHIGEITKTNLRYKLSKNDINIRITKIETNGVESKSQIKDFSYKYSNKMDRILDSQIITRMRNSSHHKYSKGKDVKDYESYTQINNNSQNKQSLQMDKEPKEIDIQMINNTSQQRPNNQVYNGPPVQDLVHSSEFYLSPAWLEYLSTGMNPKHRDRYFKSRLGNSERQMLYETMQQLQDTCVSQNIICLMYGGTLLGSWRHHHMIPWDDDIDILVNISQQEKLHDSLKKLYPTYQVTLYEGKLKFHSENARNTSIYPWKWPYIDIWFYSENETHIIDKVSTKNYKHEYSYPKNITFPVHLRPFGKLLLSAPRDTFRSLQITYTSVHCLAHDYNHKLDIFETWMKKNASCSQFAKTFGFVHRKRRGDHVIETLILGGQKIHEILVDEPTYAITYPYNLTLIQ